MPCSNPAHSQQILAHFHQHGWVHLRGAFDAAAAQAMRDATWRVLEGSGIRRNQPSTWTVARPSNLKRLKNDAAFRHIGSERVLSAIGVLLEGLRWEKPRDWGAIFLAFPGRAPWSLPASGWHVDANYGSPLLPTRGVKILGLFGDVMPRGGGTLLVSGSHRLVHRWFRQHPPPEGARSTWMRQSLLTLPYLRDLHAPGNAEEREGRFMHRAEDVLGVALQVVEAVGGAGDVFLLHPLLMHVAAPNAAKEPRFMTSGGVTTDMWGWRLDHEAAV